MLGLDHGLDEDPLKSFFDGWVEFCRETVKSTADCVRIAKTEKQRSGERPMR